MSGETEIPDGSPYAEFYGAISGLSPCGAALERYEFAELTEDCVGKKGRWDDYFQKDIGAVPPNYASARRRARELLEKSRDFRPLVRLVEIEANVGGANGLWQALHLLHCYVAEHWEETHPTAENDNGAERAKVFALLKSKKPISQGLEGSELFHGGTAGQVSMRQFLLAAELRQPSTDEVWWQPDGLAEIVSSAKAESALASAHAGLLKSADLLDLLNTELARKLERPPNLSAHSKELRSFAEALQPYSGLSDDPLEQNAQPIVEESVISAMPRSNLGGVIGDRSEAIQLMDEVIGYYAREERSSPVPQILVKLRGMNGAEFSELLYSLALQGPDSASLEIGGANAVNLDEFDSGVNQSSQNEKIDLRPLEEGLGKVNQSLDVLSNTEGLDPALSDELSKAKKTVADLVDSVRFLANRDEATSETSTNTVIDRTEIRGVIQNRTDVIQTLDRLVSFYERAEPSSPIPVLLKRAKSLVNLNFLDTIKELAPKGGESAFLTLSPST